MLACYIAIAWHRNLRYLGIVKIDSASVRPHFTTLYRVRICDSVVWCTCICQQRCMRVYRCYAKPASPTHFLQSLLYIFLRFEEFCRTCLFFFPSFFLFFILACFQTLAQLTIRNRIGNVNVAPFRKPKLWRVALSPTAAYCRKRV